MVHIAQVITALVYIAVHLEHGTNLLRLAFSTLEAFK